MTTPVIMPKLEMSQETATLIEWLKKDGDPVEKGEPLLSVETDKLTLEVESPGSGRLAGLLAQPGDVVPVTAVIAYLLAPGEALLGAPAPTGTPATPAQAAQTAPTLAPAPASAPAPIQATPVARRMADAHQLELGGISGSGPDGRITRQDVAALLSAAPAQPGKPRAVPAARRLARENGVPLQAVSGSGPKGRVQPEDVQAYVVAAQKTAQQAQAVPLVPGASNAGVEILPYKGLRRTIGERLQVSYQTAPHITFTARADMTAFDALRKQLNAYAKAHSEPTVSVTALLAKILAWTLARHPLLNSSLRGEEIHVYKSVHLGVAVALPDGLIVPVVHDAARKSAGEIAAEVADLAERARQGRLLPADVAGGTFTLSNLGPFGIEQFTAILNPGQVGILAVGAAQPEPLVVGEALAIRPLMHFTLSVDHRVVDGAVAAHFMADLKAALEAPGVIVY